MIGEERRKTIAKLLGKTPLSASKLAEHCGVSRQVIVQDIALMRAEGAKIIATNRGYIAADKVVETRVFKACHTDEETREELYLIVDAGGCVEDVFVWHKVYGKISARMQIDSRRKADAFLQKIASGVSTPLKNITGNYHYHTVTAPSEEILDDIARLLKERGFLADGD